MFNLDAITEVTATLVSTQPLETLTAEQCAVSLVAESMQDLCRPIRKLHTNERIAIQQAFNRTIAIKVSKADGSTAECIEKLAVQAAMRCQAALQSEEPEAEQEAVERLERLLNLLQDLAANVARNSFYRFDECERQEPTGDERCVTEFQTKSAYAGWSRIIIEATTMEEGAELAIKGLCSVIGALLPMASAYFQNLMSGTKKQVIGKDIVDVPCVLVQLGYQRLPEMGADNKPEYEQYYELCDVWKSIRANRRELIAPMSAAQASGAYNL